MERQQTLGTREERSKMVNLVKVTTVDMVILALCKHLIETESYLSDKKHLFV